jgi:hypothetical protein
VTLHYISYKVQTMWTREVTVREVNRFLKRVVEELRTKHGNVTSPEFERELEERTSIRYKQTKNYFNHPSPSQAIAANAKIKAIILAERRKNYPKYGALGSMLLVAVGVGGTLLWKQFQLRTISALGQPETANGTKPPTTPKIILNIDSSIRDLRLGEPTNGFRSIPWNLTQNEGIIKIYLFSKLDPNGLGLTITAKEARGQIFSISITSTEPTITHSLRDQIRSKSKSKFSLNPNTHRLETDGEYIQESKGEMLIKDQAQRIETYSVTLTSDFPF